MARINLLPWREERREQRKREFFTMLGMGAAAAVVAMLAVTWQMNNVIDNQHERNRFLEMEIKKLDEQIKEIEKLEDTREKLLARKQIIEKLQGSRSQMVHLFDALVRTMPEGAMLTSFKQTGDNLVLQGKAQSSARVSALMRNLEANDWFALPDLNVIQIIPENRVEPGHYGYEFSLKVNLKKTQLEQDEEEEGGSQL